MVSRRIFGLGLAAMALASPSLAQGKKSATNDGEGMSRVLNVAGRYSAQGMNTDGSKYEGQVEIEQEGDAVTFKWVVGNDTFRGTGQVTGKIVEVDWSAPTPVVYAIRPDGRLFGTWDDGLALERLTPR